MAFDNIFNTKKSLNLHLNLSPFKLYSISPKKRQFILVDNYSPWKDTFSHHLERLFGTEYASENILPGFSILVDLFLSLVSIIIQFLFYFRVFYVIFIKILAKIKELIFFRTEHPPVYIIIAISLSWIVLIIGFNNDSINTVSFSICLPFHVIFIKKWQKTRDCNFQQRAPIMEGCWRTSASSCCKSWRGSWLTCRKLQPCKIWCFCPLCIDLSL